MQSVTQRMPTIMFQRTLMTLALAIVLTIALACGAPQPDAQAERPTATPTPGPVPTAITVNGATWILESIDGQPPIAETHLTLTISGPQFSGFDGCNSFGGRHESGDPVVGRNGKITVPSLASTAAGCPTPEILEQARRFLDAMRRDARARVVAHDRLHITDRSGEAVLVLARQESLDGQPMDLVGTGWRLVDNDGTYGEGATTLLFLDSGAAIGTTVCRDYTVGYTASDGRIRMPYKGMSGSVEPCARDAIDREHRFIEDFGWANEYAVPRVDGSQLLVVRTGRGKTLTFEPLDATTGAIFGPRWHLTRFLGSRTDDSGMRWPRNTDVADGANITAEFDRTAIEGSVGCRSYAYQSAGEGTTFTEGDGSISLEGAALSTVDSCDPPTAISPQEGRYLDLLAAAERYHVFGDRLAILTAGGDALVFRSE